MANDIKNETLLPHHLELIRASDISPEVAEARGYRSIKVKNRLEELGFGQKQRRVPALLIPIHNVHGEIALHQIRPQNIGHVGRCQVLVDDRVDAPANALRPADNRYSTATAGNDNGAAPGQQLNQRYIAYVLRPG